MDPLAGQILALQVGVCAYGARTREFFRKKWARCGCLFEIVFVLS